MGYNETYNRENPIGPFLVNKLLGPLDPPSLPPNTSLQVLQRLPRAARFNVVLFGSLQESLFPVSRQCTPDHIAQAVACLKGARPVLGGSCLWPVLQGLYALAPAARPPRALFLFSDGDLRDPAATVGLARAHRAHTRLFAFGVGPCNAHQLQLLAAAGGGKAEVLPHRTPSAWGFQIEAQLRRAAQPSLTQTAVDWSGAANARARAEVNAGVQQAPRHLPPLFAAERAVVCGFAGHHVRRVELTALQARCRDGACGAAVEEVPVSTYMSSSPVTETRGSTLHKLTAMRLIRDWQDGLLGLDKAEDGCAKELLKQQMIALGCQYSIVTPYTSMIAIEERGEGDGQAPDASAYTLAALVAALEVDPIPEVGYEKRPEPAPVARPTRCTPRCFWCGFGCGYGYGCGRGRGCGCWGRGRGRGRGCGHGVAWGRLNIDLVVDCLPFQEGLKGGGVCCMVCARYGSRGGSAHRQVTPCEGSGHQCVSTRAVGSPSPWTQTRSPWHRERHGLGRLMTRGGGGCLERGLEGPSPKPIPCQCTPARVWGGVVHGTPVSANAPSPPIQARQARDSAGRSRP